MEMVNIKLVRSLIGTKKSQIAVLQSLGLRKIVDTTSQVKNEATMGKVRKVAHMVQLV